VLGLLYDVHGNLGALDAVLDDARSLGVTTFVLGGDYTLFGGRPAETVERLMDLDASWIRGNGERWTARPGEAPADETVQGAISDCLRALGDAMVTELAVLDEHLVLDGTLYCHASPVSDVRSFFPEPADDEPELLAGVRERRVVFGHTHLPFARIAEEGHELVNPGSVGMPLDGDVRAAWGVLHDDGRAELRRVEYDHAAAARAVRERGGGWSETVARRIELAQFSV
jgi:diadenosine tetraphosphatase ApaH/serine/threonine PP2A family protein phosphatase